MSGNSSVSSGEEQRAKKYWMTLWRYEGKMIIRLTLLVITACLIAVAVGLLLGIFLISLTAAALSLVPIAICIRKYILLNSFLARPVPSRRKSAFKGVAESIKKEKGDWKYSHHQSTDAYEIHFNDPEFTIKIKEYGRKGSMVIVGPVSGNNKGAVINMIELIDQNLPAV